jgi:hypothetical protein
MAIQDEIRAKTPDVRGFELYMLGLEAICRNAVKVAVQAESSAPRETWAAAVARRIEDQLLPSLPPSKAEEVRV